MAWLASALSYSSSNPLFLSSLLSLQSPSTRPSTMLCESCVNRGLQEERDTDEEEQLVFFGCAMLFLQAPTGTSLHNFHTQWGEMPFEKGGGRLEDDGDSAEEDQPQTVTGFIHPPTHPLTHSLTHSLTHLLAHLLTRSLSGPVHPPTKSCRASALSIASPQV